MREQPRPLYPLFLKLDGRPVLVVGAGAVGARKVAALRDCGARVTVVAPAIGDAVRGLAAAGEVTLHEREFAVADVAGMVVVVAATSDRATNELVARTARAQGAPVNVVDVPDLCDFYVPAVIRRGPVAVAVSSTGVAPGFTRRLRRELEEQLGPELAAYAELVAGARERIRVRFPDPADEERRRLALEAVLDSDARQLLAAGRGKEARAIVDAVLVSL